MRRMVKAFAFARKSSYFHNLISILAFFCLFFIYFISISIDSIYPFNLLSNALVLLFGILVILDLLFFVRKIRIDIFFCFSVVLMLSFLMSWIANGFRSFPSTPIFITLFSFLVYLWGKEKKKYFKLLFIAFSIASIFFLVLFSVTEIKHILFPNFSQLIGARYGNENDVARHLIFSLLIFLITSFFAKSKIAKIFLLFFGVYSIYLILLTGSFSNILLSFLLVVIYLIMIAKTKRAKLVRIFVIISVAVLSISLLFTVPLLSPIKNRFLSIASTLFGINTNVRSDASSEGRFYAAIYGFKLFFQSPIFGNGYNSVIANYKIMAHNNIAEISADYGIVALLTEELVLIIPFLNFKKMKNKKILFLPLIYLVLIQFFLVSFTSKVDRIVLSLIYSLGSFSINISDIKYADIQTPYFEVSI